MTHWLSGWTKKMNIAIWVRRKLVGASQCIIKKLKLLVCPKMNKIKADGLSYWLDVVEGLFHIWKTMTKKALRINGTNSRNILQNVLVITACNRFLKSFSSLPYCFHTTPQKSKWKLSQKRRTKGSNSISRLCSQNHRISRHITTSLKPLELMCLNTYWSTFTAQVLKPLWCQKTVYRKNLPSCSYRKLSCFWPKQE